MRTMAVVAVLRPWPNGPSQLGGSVNLPRVGSTVCFAVVHAAMYSGAGVISEQRYHSCLPWDVRVRATWFPARMSGMGRFARMSSVNMHCSQAVICFTVSLVQRQASSPAAQLCAAS